MKKGRGRRQRSRRRISRVGRNLRGRGAQLIAIIAPWKSVIILISREMMAWLLEDLRKLEIVYAKKKGNAWLLALIRVSLSLSKRKRLKWNKGDEITQVSLPKYMKYKNKRYLNYILLSSFLEKDFLLDCSLYETNISPPNPLITSTNSASLYKIQRISRKQWRIYIVKITRENRLLLVISPCAAVEQAFNNPRLRLHPWLVHFGRGSRGRDGGDARERR